ncbi:hypothetical protein EC9_28380 [Rosistilla ulvae]|uniref:3-keto-alpha-glucoside-1,2-lyase/3-keto-2-hydroxy-glucal hydratase domain-containing protein n=2 Tax=Rosistilla ulvae TaxID=1930277 RepID=A0A517M199_9BACT|nr:LamG domain-containing protein [Rosistilla ulvae]QDS88647.1 hypothetical protein EC9_28380 [Rosistilla ulvae]
MLLRSLIASLCATVCVSFSGSVMAEETATLIFEDDFQRNESQEQTDEVGNGWKTNSKARAGGNKQVDLRDGAMYIYIHETADHGVSVVQPAEFRDGRVEVKFMLEDDKDSLGVNFADLKFKEVWAGHLCKVDIGTKAVAITDLKTGLMDLKIRTQRRSGTLPADQQKMLKSKTKRVANALETGKWYHAVATIVGDTLSVSIDGKQIVSFSSAGIAHPTKRMLRLSVKRNVVVDDLKIYSLADAKK